jgi:DNA mismatch repair protein MSH6
MTLVDKVFTRIGASDKLLENKSTFFIEMEETKAILDKATAHSLAVLDELGRGTSTYDGLAIADAVLGFLADKVKVSCIFTKDKVPGAIRNPLPSID